MNLKYVNRNSQTEMEKGKRMKTQYSRIVGQLQRERGGEGERERKQKILK
jgi:hypothetical protein